MIEYYCSKCHTPLKVTYIKLKKEHDPREEYPVGKCPKCKIVYQDLDHEKEYNHLPYRDNIRHCPNYGKNFRTSYGDHGGGGYGLQTHTCPRCGWLIGWQHTFSHGEYLVAMESAELWDQRQHFWSQLRKYGRPDAAGDGEYFG